MKTFLQCLTIILVFMMGLAACSRDGENNGSQNNNNAANGEDFIPLSEPFAGNGSGNINNDGLASMMDGWVFYRRVVDGEWRLSKARTDGTDRQVVGSDYSINMENINAYNGWVYYTLSHEIIRIRPDGTDRQVIYTTPTEWVFFGRAKVSGDWVYFTMQREMRGARFLYRIRTDGTGLQNLHDEHQVTDIVVVGDWIYYTYGHIYKMRTDGTELHNLRQNVPDGETWFASRLNVVGDWIFFTGSVNGGSQGVYRMKTDGTAFERINDARVQYLNATDNWLYFTVQSGPTFHIYKSRHDGSERYRLRTEQTNRIYILDDILGLATDVNGAIYLMNTDGSGWLRIFGT
jgi:hypothetical protein